MNAAPIANHGVATSPAPKAGGTDRAGAAAGRDWRWALASLALGTTALLAVFRDAVAALLETWWGSPSFEHGLLVPMVAALVVWFDRKALSQLVPRPWPLGVALVAVAAVAAAFGAAASTLLLQQLALVLSIQALAAMVLGREITRRIAFPLAFLYFAVPFGDVMVPALRDVTAAASVELLSRMGVTATLDGFLIRLPSADYRVAEACAGLRFLLVGVAIGLLAAKLFLRSRARWALLVLLAVAVPIAANIGRTALIIALSENGLMEPDSAWSHLTYGMGFNAVIITILLLLVFLLRDAAVAVAAGPPEAGVSRPIAFAIFAAAAVTVPALGLALGQRDQAPRAAASLIPPVPAVGARWQPVPQVDHGWRPRAAGADAEFMNSYADGQARIDLYIGFFSHQRQGAEIINDANRLNAAGDWQEVGRRPVSAAIEGSDVSSDAVVSRAGNRRRLTMQFYWVDGIFSGSAVVAKWRQATATLLGRDPAAAVIVVSTVYREDPGLAAARLRDFLATLAPLPRKRGSPSG